MQVRRIVLALFIVSLAAFAYPCQPDRFTEYFSDSAFTQSLGWAFCSCTNSNSSYGQQSGPYKKVTTTSCTVYEIQHTYCYYWDAGSGTYVPMTCP
jgi:hypothetical protein